MFAKNELTDFIWTKLLKIMFMVESMHYESGLNFVNGLRFLSADNVA